MTKKLSLNEIMWNEDISEFDETFIESYDDGSMEDILLRLMFSILKNYMIFTFLPKIQKAYY